MPLDRKTVNRTTAEHVRLLRASGARLTDGDKQAIRKMHERAAERVARRAGR